MSLPEEILNLRIPISRLFLKEETENQNDTSNNEPPMILIWHHIQKCLKGGRPVERLVRQLIGEDLLKDNEQALEELKSLVEILIESNTNKNRQKKSTTTTQNQISRIPTPPSSSPSNNNNNNKTQLFQHLRRPESARMITMPQQNENNNNHITSKTTFESFIDSIKSRLESTNNFLDQHHQISRNNNSSVDHLNLLSQIHMYLQRENVALLADAEDVRKLIAGKSVSSNNNNNNVDESNRSNSSSPSTFQRPPTAASSRGTEEVLSTETTPIKSLLRDVGATSTTSTTSSVFHQQHRQVISEVTTSRVRAKLLSRMNQSQNENDDDFDQDAEKQNISSAKATTTSPKPKTGYRGIFGEEEDDEDDEMPDGLF